MCEILMLMLPNKMKAYIRIANFTYMVYAGGKSYTSYQDLDKDFLTSIQI